jgi:NAD(P)H dehydrogenase (quinone)
MRVLTVYAHYNPRSFCHAVLEQFTIGLRDAGHTVEVVDLYAIEFDPVFRERDGASYVHEDMPPDILESMNLKERVLGSVPGGPVGRFLIGRRLRDKSPAEVARFIREHAPKDAREQWVKVAASDAVLGGGLQGRLGGADAPHHRRLGTALSRCEERRARLLLRRGDCRPAEGYLRRAYELGRGFADVPAAAGVSSTGNRTCATRGTS